MKKQITNISGHQTGKVMALIYVLITSPCVLVGIVGLIFGGPMEVNNGPPVDFPWALFIFAPLIYGVMGYIFIRFGCFIYNFIAKRFGGIEFTVIETPSISG